MEKKAEENLVDSELAKALRTQIRVVHIQTFFLSTNEKCSSRSMGNIFQSSVNFRKTFWATKLMD